MPSRLTHTRLQRPMPRPYQMQRYWMERHERSATMARDPCRRSCQRPWCRLWCQAMSRLLRSFFLHKGEGITTSNLYLCPSQGPVWSLLTV